MWVKEQLKQAICGVQERMFESLYGYKAGLREVPEGLPELQIQVLGNAFKLSSPQLWIHDILP